MIDAMTKVINVEDYPDIDPDTEDGKEEFGHLAVEMTWHNKALTHFIFQRGGQMIGEMYVTDMLESQH